MCSANDKIFRRIANWNDARVKINQRNRIMSIESIINSVTHQIVCKIKRSLFFHHKRNSVIIVPSFEYNIFNLDNFALKANIFVSRFKKKFHRFFQILCKINMYVSWTSLESAAKQINKKLYDDLCFWISKQYNKLKFVFL